MGGKGKGKEKDPPLAFTLEDLDGLLDTKLAKQIVDINSNITSKFTDLENDIRAKIDTKFDEKIPALENKLLDIIKVTIEPLSAKVDSLREDLNSKDATIVARIDLIETECRELRLMNIDLRNKVKTLEDKPDIGIEAIENLKTENEIFFDTKMVPLFLLQSIEQYNKQAIAFNIPPPASDQSDYDYGIDFLSNKLNLTKPELADHSPSTVQIRNRNTDKPFMILTFKNASSRTTILRKRTVLRGSKIILKESLPFEYQTKNRDYNQKRNFLLAKHPKGTLQIRTYFDGPNYILACKPIDTDVTKYAWTIVDSFVPKITSSKVPRVSDQNNLISFENPLMNKNTALLTLEKDATTIESFKELIENTLESNMVELGIEIFVSHKARASIKTLNEENAIKVKQILETVKPFEGNFTVIIIINKNPLNTRD